MKAGEHVKVRLPGESPWAEIIRMIDETQFVGRIDNKVAGDYSAQGWHEMLATMFGVNDPWQNQDRRPHKYMQGEYVVFHATEYGFEPLTPHLGEQQ